MTLFKYMNTSSFSRDEILVLTEGQETNLTCVAEGAIPAPSFSWQGAVNLTSVPGGRGASLGEDDQHTAWQTVQYTARLNDTGRKPGTFSSFLNIYFVMSCRMDWIENP